MAGKQGRRLTSQFNLGGEQAEADPLLQEAFYNSADFQAMLSPRDPRCFIIGRTGSGKSAALQRLEEVRPEHVIRITPEDLALPYITDVGAVRFMDSLDVHLDLLFIALWKHVLLIEIIRRRYNIDSQVAKQNFLQTLREKISRDHAKRAALEYLDEFEGKFWCETDERVREITDRFQERVSSELKATLGSTSLPASLGGGGGTEFLQESGVRRELVERFQRIVNETQLARLNKMMVVLNEDILDNTQHYTYVVIDDLDRDWVDDRLANDLIKALFRSVLDLKRVTNLKVLVALRTNIFTQLDFRGSSGGQEEKFRSLIFRLSWTPNDLEKLLDERVRVVTELNGPAVRTHDLLPRPNQARGDALGYVLERTLLRPRDAIAFLNECLRVGVGKTRLSWEDIKRAERTYSENRLLALRDEWKTNFTDIDRVFDQFRAAQIPMNHETVATILDEVMLLPADPSFRGVHWLTPMSEAMMSGLTDDWATLYGPLLRLLYDIGFLGVAHVQGPDAFAHDEPGLLDKTSGVEQATWFTLHPAFCRALDCRENVPRRSQ